MTRSHNSLPTPSIFSEGHTALKQRSTSDTSPEEPETLKLQDSPTIAAAATSAISRNTSAWVLRPGPSRKWLQTHKNEREHAEALEARLFAELINEEEALLSGLHLVGRLEKKKELAALTQHLLNSSGFPIRLELVPEPAQDAPEGGEGGGNQGEQGHEDSGNEDNCGNGGGPNGSRGEGNGDNEDSSNTGGGGGDGPSSNFRCSSSVLTWKTTEGSFSSQMRIEFPRTISFYPANFFSGRVKLFTADSASLLLEEGFLVLAGDDRSSTVNASPEITTTSLTEASQTQTESYSRANAVSINISSKLGTQAMRTHTKAETNSLPHALICESFVPESDNELYDQNRIAGYRLRPHQRNGGATHKAQKNETRFEVEMGTKEVHTALSLNTMAYFRLKPNQPNSLEAIILVHNHGIEDLYTFRGSLERGKVSIGETILPSGALPVTEWEPDLDLKEKDPAMGLRAGALAVEKVPKDTVKLKARVSGLIKRVRKRVSQSVLMRPDAEGEDGKVDLIQMITDIACDPDGVDVLLKFDDKGVIKVTSMDATDNAPSLAHFMK